MPRSARSSQMDPPGTRRHREDNALGRRGVRRRPRHLAARRDRAARRARSGLRAYGDGRSFPFLTASRRRDAADSVFGDRARRPTAPNSRRAAGAGTRVAPRARRAAEGEKDRGRDARCRAPPAQIRTGRIRAYGSHLGFGRVDIGGTRRFARRRSTPASPGGRRAEACYHCNGPALATPGRPS